jgi:hypothetical protein
MENHHVSGLSSFRASLPSSGASIIFDQPDFFAKSEIQ